MRQELTQVVQQNCLKKGTRGSLRGMTQGVLSYLGGTQSRLTPSLDFQGFPAISACPELFNIICKNSENELSNKILEKQKRSVQKKYMSILFAREICISNPLYEFLSEVSHV